MSGIKSHYLQDKDGNKFYPQSHAGASYTRDGSTVEQKLDEIDEKLEKINSIEPSEINGNIKINNVETIVYTHPEGTNPHGTTKEDLGLENVENKSSETIRAELTKDDINNALSYTPYTPIEVDDKLSENISTHNTSTNAHSDIRELISGLTTRLNTLADSDDTTLDQLSEIVAYIKSNKSLIENITTNKVDVNNIINDLTTNVDDKPLSATQGVVLKGLIDTLETEIDSHIKNTTVHITSTERTNWNDTYNQKHIHNNKTILDNTTASFTIEDKEKLDSIIIQASTTDLEDGVSELAKGTIYLVYE